VGRGLGSLQDIHLRSDCHLPIHAILAPGCIGGNNWLYGMRITGDALTLKLYERVALKIAVPAHGLRAGDVATVVDFVDHPTGGPRGCVLEVFNALGESIAVVAVAENAVETLRADEVLSVRPLAVAG
jgi:hypothetical protein